MRSDRIVVQCARQLSVAGGLGLLRQCLTRAWSEREAIHHHEHQEGSKIDMLPGRSKTTFSLLLGALSGDILVGQTRAYRDGHTPRVSSRQPTQKFFASFFQKRSAFFLAFAGGFVVVTQSANAAEPALKVCVDTSSPTAAHDRDIAESVARQAGMTLSVTPFNSSDADDGFPAKDFRKLLTHGCDLVMGYPVDATEANLPEGLLATKPYAQTGFVLVTAPGRTAHSLSDLPAGSEVAVTFEAPPNLYIVDHPNVSADTQKTDADTLAAVLDGHDPAGMVWQPTVDAYLAAHPGVAKPGIYPLAEPHARFNVVALYLPAQAKQAATFNATKISMNVPAKSDTGAALPTLYTAAQAKSGYAKFIGNCAMCHGVNLQGKAGPALKGPNWANAKADYTVGEVFTVVSQQMPANRPRQPGAGRLRGHHGFSVTAKWLSCWRQGARFQCGGRFGS